MTIEKVKTKVKAQEKTPAIPLENLPKFTIQQLLEAGVHFGHKTSRRNTKMVQYLFGVRNGLNVIDLQKTGFLLNESLKVVYQIARNNGRILFVATKKQASDTVATMAKKCGQYYVNYRWLGGMLTNWKTVSKSIKTLKDIENQLSNEGLDLNKKEKLVLERKRQKLEDTLGGIKDMGGYPDLVFVIDTHREALAIAEAKKIGIPVMAILDSNCNPDGITFRIPGNDDSIKSIRLYCHLLSESILAGMRENMATSGLDLKKTSTSQVINKDTKKVASKTEKGSKIEVKTEEKKVVAKTFAPKKAENSKAIKVAPKKVVTEEVEIPEAKTTAPKKAVTKKTEASEATKVTPKTVKKNTDTVTKKK